MTLFTADQLIAHAVGDYVLQSDWMANEKTKKKAAALAHVITYALPFLFLSPSLLAMVVIIATHFIIDHWRLARYVCWVKNFLAPKLSGATRPDGVEYTEVWWRPWSECSGTGYHRDRPRVHGRLAHDHRRQPDARHHQCSRSEVPVKIDRFFNDCFDFILGRRPDGEARLYMHSQNLNEDRNGDVKGWPWHGRLFLRSFRKPILHFSWNLWTHFCGVSVEADPEDGGTKFHIAFPPFSFWFTLPFGAKKHQYSHHVYFNISVHDWSLWWQFGGDSMSWHSKTPKWKHGNFNLPDFVLGRTEYKAEVVETKEVVIPMPEGAYPGIAKMERCVWKRPRWFALRRTSIWIDIPKGIPHEGKGENSWDCGKDGLFGCGVNSELYEDAVAHVVKTAMKSRRKYDGNMLAKYPAPEAAHV